MVVPARSASNLLYLAALLRASLALWPWWWCSQETYPWNMGRVLWLLLTVAFPLFQQIWTSQMLSSLVDTHHHLVSPKASVALGCMVLQQTASLFPFIAWVISSMGDKVNTILLATSSWFAVRCWMLLSAAYAAKAIFCSKIDSTMYKVEFHLVATSCLSLCLSSCRFS